MGLPVYDHPLMNRIGAIAAFVCAGTYLIGFALLMTILSPLGYGSNEIDSDAVIKFINENPSFLIYWNLIIYIVNAIALLVLVTAISQRLNRNAPLWATVSKSIGLIWAGLVLGAGMVGNVAVEQAESLYTIDPELAAQTWRVLHAVELGLGGGNEIAGAVWIFCVSVGRSHSCKNFSLVALFGIVVGICGMMTIVPKIGDIAGAIFGIGMIVWFIIIGTNLLFSRCRRNLSGKSLIEQF